MTLLLALIAALASAQTVTLTPTGPATVRAGQALTVTISSSGATANGPSGVQWTAAPPAGMTITAVAPGAAATAASKSIACNATNTLCISYGINQNVIANGAVAALTVQVPGTATGPASIALSGLVAGDKNGGAMPTAAGAPYAFIVLARSDLNGDGKTDSADVLLMAQQATGASCTDDQNGDGACNVLDVLIVSLRALGL